MKHLLPHMGRRSRGAVMTAVSVLVLLAAILLGIGASAVKDSLSSYIDMTAEGLYTMTDEFLAEVEHITDDITITFCADPDVLLNNYDTRYVYILARELEQRMDNVKVVTCDVVRDPTAVQPYRTTSSTTIHWNDVIVSCDKRYRVLAAKAFFSTDTTTNEYFAFNGEHKLASVMLSITAIDRPAVYFTVGHGEAVYDPANPNDPQNEKNRAFYQLLIDSGLEVKTLELNSDPDKPIPDDCVLLIMNGPTADYAAAPGDRLTLGAMPPLEKIDRYLDGQGALMVFKDPFVTLPALEEYLVEWGIVYENNVTLKSDRTGAGDDAALESARDRLVAVYPDKSKHPMAGSLFGDVAELSSAPRTVVAKSGYLTSEWESGTRLFSVLTSAMTSPVLLSSETTAAYDAEGRLTDDAGGYALAQMTVRTRLREDGDIYSYVFCAATTALTATEYIDNPTYANYDVLFSTIRTISRTDAYASDSLGGLNMNSEKYGGKRFVDTTISPTKKDVYKNGKIVYTYLGLTGGDIAVWTVLLLLPSLVSLGVGIFMLVRRRYR